MPRSLTVNEATVPNSRAAIRERRMAGAAAFIGSVWPLLR